MKNDTVQVTGGTRLVCDNDLIKNERNYMIKFLDDADFEDVDTWTSKDQWERVLSDCIHAIEDQESFDDMILVVPPWKCL